MKLKRDQQRWFDHLKEHGTPRGMTLGRGRPHDRRTLQTLIDAHWIKPTTRRPDILQDDYAVRGDEDKNGLALLVCPQYGMVWGATSYGVEVHPLSADDYASHTDDQISGAIENGNDTAWEMYPHDTVRREWQAHATTRSTLAMYE